METSLVNIRKFLSDHIFLPFIKREAVSSFYIEKKARLNEIHIIHINTCDLLPDEEGRKKLGFFGNLSDLLKAGEEKFEHVKLCKYCLS
ncbi:hypothetical protein [Gillisia hiemivivida]|jgi:hypothetical protein|uniref:Uncharacterized protein n=1 Tax=Gillisia hiemivivida TaxID=291190 RepID=A0A5C6ZWW6_9FLAO|nr:hypothetical protein [Gillisia hiemivivida]TXD95493.1 hypothetical protein ES724_00210 [Gillisia hiemivivida]